MARVLMSTLVEVRLTHQTVGLVRPTEITFDDAARLVASVIDIERPFVRTPLVFHSLLAQIIERLMKVPLISTARVQILKEEIIEPILAPDELSEDLKPRTAFDGASIRAGLPASGPFTSDDLRWCLKALPRSAF